MPRDTLFRLTLILLLLPFLHLAVPLPATAGAQETRPATSGTLVPRTDRVAPEEYLSDTPPALSPEERARLEKALEQTHLPGPPVPAAPREQVLPTPERPTSLIPADEALRSIRIFRDTTLGSTASPLSSQVNEPSVDKVGKTVLYTGNWYAAVSHDSGATFRYIDPFDGPFPPVDNGFCCDQVVVADHERGTIFWLQQYMRTDSGNTQRINVDSDADGTFDCAYDLHAAHFGRPAGEWLDFPDLVLGDHYLYHTTNIFDPSDHWTSAVVVRYSLDAMASCEVVPYDYYLSTREGSPRVTHGISNEALWATHETTSSLHICRWREDRPSPSCSDHEITPWTFFDRGDATCPDEDGRDMCTRMDARILGAYMTGNVVGFMWSVAQDQSHPMPYTRVVEFAVDDLHRVREASIWNPDYAWVYPSVAVNHRGHFGGTILVGGGSYHLSCAAWIVDDLNNMRLAPLENRLVRTGSAGPIDDKAGDYLAARRHDFHRNTWIGTCYTLRSGGTEGEPVFVHFGRERDHGNRPPVADAGADQRLECDSPDGTLAHLDGSGSWDPDGDPLSYDWNGPFLENGGRARGEKVMVHFPLGDHTVQLTVDDGRGGTDDDHVQVLVEDTSPPVGNILFPIEGSCHGPGGVVVADYFHDICDPDITRSYDPPPGPRYDEHGDYTVVLTATDSSGNSGSDTVHFTIDLVPPVVHLAGGNLAIPRPSAPMTLFFTSTDDDGASGGVVHERVLLDGCVLYDGDTYGDGDGLLSDEDLSTTVEELCSVASRCGFGVLVDPLLRVEAEDCGGNVGYVERVLPGAARLRPGLCDGGSN